MWDEITYPFLNFNGATVEVLGMTKQFYPTLFWPCNYLSMWGLKLIHVSERGPWDEAVTLYIMISNSTSSSAELVASSATSNAETTMAQDQQQSDPPTFAAWAKEHHLTAATCQFLTDNGCDSMPIVLSLLEEDIREMPLNIEQRCMLLRAVNPTGNTRHASSETAVPRVAMPATQFHAQSMSPNSTPAATPALQPSVGELPLADLLHARQAQVCRHSVSWTSTVYWCSISFVSPMQRCIFDFVHLHHVHEQSSSFFLLCNDCICTATRVI